MTSRFNSDLSRRRVLGIGALAVAGVGSASLARAFPNAKSVRRSAVAFGTVVSITLVDDGSVDLEPVFKSAFDAIREIERAASLFDAHSEICRLNADGCLQDPSSHMLNMLQFALRISAATDGAYDPSVQPIWCAWQSARREGRLPNDVELAAAVERTDWRKIHVRPDRIEYAGPGMSITLNSVAQGYATDLVFSAVAARGVRHAFIDTGEISAQGRRADDTPWRVAIASPRKNDESLGVVSVGTERFFATSADNACNWTEDYREHHIVEPRSGHSPSELSKVVIAASSGLAADGLSTAIMLIGSERARSLVETIDPGSSVLMIDKAGRTSTLGPVFSHIT